MQGRLKNQAYVVAVNRVGDNPDNKFNGHSLIINPLGEVLSDSGDQETLTVYDLDTSEMENSLNKFMYLKIVDQNYTTKKARKDDGI